MSRRRPLGRALLAAVALVALAPADGALAQSASSVLDGPPPAAGPQPLWVPDPEHVADPAAEADVADVSEAAGIELDAAIAGDAARVAVAHWMAAGAREAGLPGELPVMAALVESGLRNLPYGDADSVGFFQMRLGVWDHGPYAGYLAQPELQLRWFVDHALAVRDARRLAGDASFGDDPAQWGGWIADTERPYAGYRGRYALRLDEARALLAQPAADVSPLQLGLTVGGPAAPDAGDASGDALAARVLTDPAITLDERAAVDLSTPGRVDPRVSAVLLEAAALFPISLWVIETGHSYYTVHGSVSNHSFGRAVDIGSVGGEVVSASNDAAHELALALGRLPAPLRPTEIGSPWAIDDPAYFTDAGHRDHLHVGFDDPPAAGDGAVAAELETYSAAVEAPARRAAPRAEPRFEAGGAPRKRDDTGAEPGFEVAG